MFYTNQAAVCTNRYDKRALGSQPQRHFIQRMCATTPGQAIPILSLEKCLGLGRAFWSCASADPHSVLGALLNTVLALTNIQMVLLLILILYNQGLHHLVN